MKLQTIGSGIGMAAILLAAGMALAPASHAQYGSQQQQQQPPPTLQPPPQQQKPGKAAPQQEKPAAPKIDPQEEAAYKAFTDTNPSDADKEVQLGEDFLQKYPTSKYDEAVNSRLTQAYFNKQQFDKMYASSDKALALNPDDVTVLVLVGWVIPHNYDPNDINSEHRLAQAEQYEEHAISVLGTMIKPTSMTDDQFSKAKNAALSQAHSGLGLVDFRKQDFANSINELQQSEQLAETPDPTDFYVMGIELNQLKKYSEAVDAFNKCAQIPGALADRCKQSAAQAKKLAATEPTPPKP